MSQNRAVWFATKQPLLAQWGCTFIAAFFLLLSPIANAQVDVHGFVSQGYLKSTGNNYLGQTKNGSLAYGEIGLNFGADLGDARVGTQIFARTLGALGNLRPEVDWAFIDYSITDWFNLRAGLVKQPYGLYGEYQDLDLTRTTVLMPPSVYYLALRDLLIAFNGVQAYGNVDLSDYSLGSFDYQVSYGRRGVPDPDNSSVTDFFKNRGYDQFKGIYAINVSDLYNSAMTSLALQWNTPLEDLTDYKWGTLLLKFTHLRFGSSYAEGQIGDAYFDELMGRGLVSSISQKDFRITFPNTVFWVASLEYTYENAVFAAEYARYHGDFLSNNTFVSNMALNQERWYVQLSYRFTDWFEAATYLSVQNDPTCRNGDLDCKDLAGNRIYGNGIDELLQPHYNAFSKDLALSMRFDITDYWLFKIEGHLIDGTIMVGEKDNPDNPYLERYWTIFGLKTTVTF
ncbi:MAG: hypothetical protein VYA34_01545 [Myxococcota bacterium]|nr:hypothetical protein [Myxococcota bacterium]